MVSGPLHETTPGKPATAIRIPVVPCDASGAKPKSSPRGRRVLDASSDRVLMEGNGEVFSLDILSHWMSATACFSPVIIKRFAIPTPWTEYCMGRRDDCAEELGEWRGVK